MPFLNKYYTQLVGIFSSVLLRKADEQNFALKWVLPIYPFTRN